MPFPLPPIRPSQECLCMMQSKLFMCRKVASNMRIHLLFTFLLYLLFSSNRLKQAPVTMALVISIIALYLVLLGFCIRADKHDKKKLGAVYISENITGGISQR